MRTFHPRNGGPTLHPTTALAGMFEDWPGANHPARFVTVRAIPPPA